MKSFIKIGLVIAVLAVLSFGKSFAQEGFMGEIRMFAGNFAPRGWMNCEGQILPVAQNTALFSILGSTYGGDGRTTFALPDMRGRVVVGPGSGPGLSTYRDGQKGGSETVILTNSNLPTNPIPAMGEGVDNGTGVKKTTETVPNSRQAGVSTVQPYMSVRYIICVNGTYPSRN